MYLTDCVDGFDAHTITGYVLHDGRTGAQVHVPYPKTAEGTSETGRAFHHGRFVTALRTAARGENT